MRTRRGVPPAHTPWRSAPVQVFERSPLVHAPQRDSGVVPWLPLLRGAVPDELWLRHGMLQLGTRALVAPGTCMGAGATRKGPPSRDQGFK